MTGPYLLAAARLGWLLAAVESTLADTPDGAFIDRSVIQAVPSRRLPTHDEATVAINALVDLGVLVRAEGGHRLDRVQLAATAEYRRGVHDALALQFAPGQGDPGVMLCVAFPPGLDPRIEAALRRHAVDLRSTIIDLIAATHTRLVLASPFWDADTVADMANLLERRLNAGVGVRILGRFGTHTDPDVMRQLAALAARGCKLYEWYQPSAVDPFGAITFHFKAAVSDGGERAYLGTANFTTSGLRSRMEIGVVLGGETAGRLARIVDAVLGLARPVALALD